MTTIFGISYFGKALFILKKLVIDIVWNPKSDIVYFELTYSISEYDRKNCTCRTDIPNTHLRNQKTRFSFHM